MFKSQKFKPVLIFVILIGLIALGYSYYFLVYVVQNQQAIDIRSFRRLEAINNVIDNKLEQFYIKFSQQEVNEEQLGILESQFSQLTKTLQVEQTELIDNRIKNEKARVADSLSQIAQNSNDSTIQQAVDSLNTDSTGIAESQLIEELDSQAVVTNETPDTTLESSSKKTSESKKAPAPVDSSLNSRNEEAIINTAEKLKNQATVKKQIKASIKIDEDISEKFSVKDRKSMIANDTTLKDKLEISEEFYLSMGFGDHSWNYEAAMFFDDLQFADYFDELAVIQIKGGINPLFQSADFSAELNPSFFKDNPNATFLLNFKGIQYKGYYQRSPIDDVLVVGLKSSLAIQAEAESIDQYLIIFLFILLVVSVISYPFLKLLFLGKNDRLKISDLYVLGITTILGFAIILNIHFIFIYHNDNVINRVENNLTELGMEIKGEIDTNISQLNRKLDDFKEKAKKQNLSGEEPLGLSKREIFKRADDTTYRDEYFPENYYVIDDNEQSPTIKLFSDSTYTGDQQFPIQDRAYYTDAINGNLKNDSKNYFAIESIYSWTSNIPEVVITKPFKSKDSNYVAAIATEQFNATFDRHLPFGYQFMVVDKSGEVILHSNKYLNRRENIFDEVDIKDKLRDVIITESEHFTTIDYHRVEQSAKVVPLPGLDWSLIVLKDSSLDKFEELSIFYYSLLMALTWFVVIVVITMILKATAYRSKSLKKNVFAYFWLLPSHQGQKYVLKTCLNVLLIALQVALYFLIDNIVIAFQSHIAIIILTGLSNFLILYPTNDQHIKDLLRDPTFIKFSGLQLFLLLLNLVILFGYSSNVAGLILLASAITILISLANIQFPLFENFIDSIGFSSSRAYQNFLFTWLLLVVLVPSSLYFRIISHEDEKSWIQAAMITDAQTIQENAHNSKIDLRTYVHKKAYGQRIFTIEFTKACDAQTEISEIDKIQSDLFRTSRLLTSMFFSDDAKIPQGKTYENVDNENYEFKEYKIRKDDSNNNKYVLVANVNDDTDENPKTREALKISYSSVGNHGLGLLIRSPLIIILILIVAYNFIKLISFKALNAGLIASLIRQERDEILTINVLSEQLSRRFFVTSPHSSGVINDISKKISDHHIINFNNLPEEFDIPDNSTLIITGFEQDLTDVEHNEEKIEFFNQFSAYNGCIIVRSAVEIDFLFSQYDKLIADPSFADDHTQLIHQRSQWHDIFRNYIQIHFPMYGDAYIDGPEEIEKVLYRVLGGSYFLWKLREQVKNKIITSHDKLPTGRALYEKVVIQTQLYANSYFHELWNQCTDSEKLILFDLAEDGILNGLDKISIKNLYQKGLIRESKEKEDKLDYPVIFSESFGNFILESSALDEAKELEREYKRKGKWSNYSLIFGTFILSLLAFFIIAEPHYLDRVNSIIAASTAAIPLLVQLSKGLFSFNFGRGNVSG